VRPGNASTKDVDGWDLPVNTRRPPQENLAGEIPHDIPGPRTGTGSVASLLARTICDEVGSRPVLTGRTADDVPMPPFVYQRRIRDTSRDGHVGGRGGASPPLVAGMAVGGGSFTGSRVVRLPTSPVKHWWIPTPVALRPMPSAWNEARQGKGISTM
jgi:hypothetical protein